jgi:hypothetical protein
MLSRFAATGEALGKEMERHYGQHRPRAKDQADRRVLHGHQTIPSRRELFSRSR